MTLQFNKLSGLSYYGICLAILSVILGIISVIHTIQFRSKIESRFVRIRKPVLTITYCIFAAIGLLITSPFQAYIAIYHLEDDPEQYSKRLLYQEWGFAMLEETAMSAMLLAVAIRCWLLLYAHSYSIAVNDRTWRGAINPTESDTDFWIKHKKTLGSGRFVGTIAAIYWLIIVGTLCGLSPSALRNKDFYFLNLIDLYFVAIPCVMFIFSLIIYGNATNIFVLKADKYAIIREMQYLAATMVLFIVVHILQSLDAQKLYLMTETIHVLFKFLSAYIQNRWVVLKQNEHDAAEYNVVLQLHNSKFGKKRKRKKKADLPGENKEEEKAGGGEVRPLQMVDVLRNRYGFGMFMRFCSHEMNVEGLLFITEVAQFKAQISSDAAFRDHSSQLDHSSSGRSFERTPSLTPDPKKELKMEYKFATLAKNDQQKQLKKAAIERFGGNILSQDWIPIANQFAKHDRETRKKEEKPDTVKITNYAIDVLIHPYVDSNTPDPNSPKFQKSVDVDWVYDYALYLFFKYVDADSEYTINVSYEARDELLEFFAKDKQLGFESILNKYGVSNNVLNDNELALNNIEYNSKIKKYFFRMFDKAHKECWEMLAYDSFMRFMRTSQYQFLMEKHQKQQLAVDIV